MAGAAERFRYLHVGLGIILGFVGIKLVLSDVWHPPTWSTLAVIAVVLGATFAVCWGRSRSTTATPAPQPPQAPQPASEVARETARV